MKIPVNWWARFALPWERNPGWSRQFFQRTSSAMRNIVLAFLVLFGFLTGGPVVAETTFPSADWQRIEPAEAGWSEAKLAGARVFSEQIKSSAVFIVQHGKVVAAW